VSWIIRYREKGDDAGFGGFYVASSVAERDEMTAHLKSYGLRVVWELA